MNETQITNRVIVTNARSFVSGEGGIPIENQVSSPHLVINHVVTTISLMAKLS